VDQRNHHLFQPLLYQVATAGLAATDIASPIRNILADQENCTVLLARATGIDAARNVLRLDDGKEQELAYDALILAVGVTNAYFGHDAWGEHAPGLKSLEEALDIRRRVLLAYERAEREDDPDERSALLTFVVIGGGPTGVELAGALSEIARRTMMRNFRHFDPSDAKVHLLEGGPRLLPGFPESLSAQAKEDLEALGVLVSVEARAKEIDANGVSLEDRRIEARTVLWAAGVGGVPLVRTLGVPLARGDRVPVEETLRVVGLKNVFAVGDMAAFQQDGAQLPGVAQVAMQGGRLAADNALRTLGVEGGALKPFRYRDLGSMATIGRSRAVAVLGRMNLTGILAWFAWLFVHLMALVGFRNRLTVLLEWSWAYLTYERGARVILEPARAISKD
jgi:NADH dehydrogenase